MLRRVGSRRLRSFWYGPMQAQPRYRMRPAEAARVVGVEYRVEDGTQDTVVALRLQLAVAAGRAPDAEEEEEQEEPSVLEGCEFEVAVAPSPAPPRQHCRPPSLHTACHLAAQRWALRSVIAESRRWWLVDGGRACTVQRCSAPSPPVVDPESPTYAGLPASLLAGGAGGQRDPEP